MDRNRNVGDENRITEYPSFIPCFIHNEITGLQQFGATMNRLHLHMLSDSTGETLENIAKAALAQFDGVEIIKHFWPMVRSE